jgi:hypothetical protein
MKSILMAHKRRDVMEDFCFSNLGEIKAFIDSLVEDGVDPSTVKLSSCDYLSCEWSESYDDRRDMVLRSISVEPVTV